MAVNPSLVMRIVSASVAVSNRASNIIRNVLTKGDLGIIEKVCFNVCTVIKGEIYMGDFWCV
jgi:hypothetical protein